MVFFMPFLAVAVAVVEKWLKSDMSCHLARIQSDPEYAEYREAYPLESWIDYYSLIPSCCQKHVSVRNFRKVEYALAAFYYQKKNGLFLRTLFFLRLPFFKSMADHAQVPSEANINGLVVSFANECDYIPEIRRLSKLKFYKEFRFLALLWNFSGFVEFEHLLTPHSKSLGVMVSNSAIGIMSSFAECFSRRFCLTRSAVKLWKKTLFQKYSTVLKIGRRKNIPVLITAPIEGHAVLLIFSESKIFLFDREKVAHRFRGVSYISGFRWAKDIRQRFSNATLLEKYPPQRADNCVIVAAKFGAYYLSKFYGISSKRFVRFWSRFKRLYLLRTRRKYRDTVYERLFYRPEIFGSN